MKVLVTGGAGFIGNHVVDRFVRNGDEVEIIDNLTTGKHVPDVPFHYHDVTLPMRGIFSGFKPDVVIHLAAQVSVATSIASPYQDARINVGGTLEVLEAARRVKARVIFASSSAVYRDGTPLYDEYAQQQPSSPYGMSKLSAEQYVLMYARSHNVDHVVLRLANVYGPGQNINGSGEGAVVPAFINAAQHGGPITVNGTGNQSRDFIYVEDVANAFASAASSSPRFYRNRIYNIGTESMTPVNVLADEVRKLSDDVVRVEHRPARKGDIKASGLATVKARRELSWSPIVELAEGLRRTYQSFARQQALV